MTYIHRASRITDSDIREYEVAGAICLRGVFSADWIARLVGAVDIVLALGNPQEFQLRHSLAASNGDIRAFVHESPCASIARELMRSETVRYYFDQLFVKEPGVDLATPWHHDQPYWPVSGRQICSVWIPLDPVSKANSGLEYVRGSHLWGKEYAPVAFLPGRQAQL